MMPLIAWIGAITGLFAGVIMLVVPVPADVRNKTRLRGLLYLGVGAMGLVMALGMGRGVL